MPGADQHHQLHASSSHHERTYFLSSQECQEQINIISFIPAPATMRELTNYEAKNATSISDVHNVPIPNFVTVKMSWHNAPITEPPLQDSLPVESYFTIIIHGLLMLFHLGQCLVKLTWHPWFSSHSTNDCQMQKSFDLPQYVETTLQSFSASECTHLLILAMTPGMLF
jgi:hypothetical protein